MKEAIDLCELVEQYGDDDQCRVYLQHLRWPTGVRCPKCNGERMSWIQSREQFNCDNEECRYQFSTTAGTIFHDTHLALTKWFLAVFLICQSRKGISANQLKRMLRINYRTAWYLCHRIRHAMEEANPKKLSGTVEVDETYIGGKQRYVGSGCLDNKTMVLGAVERGGNVRLKVEPRKQATKKVLHGFITEVTEPNTERIITDEHRGYRGIADADTKHETVNHRQEEWVRGDIHTNTVESVWSLFDRSIIGAFHKVSTKHLNRYLSEFEWRFNNRKNPFLFRDTMLRLIASDKLEYKELTKSA